MAQRRTLLRTALLAAALLAPGGVRGALTINVEANGWPSAAHRNAAVSALQSAANRYNAYGDFGNYNVYAYYNAGIPTAQANYLGSIGYGGTYPNERVSMHEMAHYLGSGTYGTPWDGARGEAIIDQFDGLEATLNGDSAHFWPYGLNYDSEGSEINKQRAVAVLYAQRADMGVGSTAIPGATGAITMTASDPLGESGFNYASRWSDTHFSHFGATYSTGNFLLRTPASGNSFNFVGDSLTINNTNGINGGLLYKGTGTTGVTGFKNLILNGGYVRHASNTGDLFRLAGKVTVTGAPVIDAAQGPITITASVEGTGSLNKSGSQVLTLSGAASYTGGTNISSGVLRLTKIAPVASYSFDNVSVATVVNDGSGGASMNGTLTGGALIVTGGQTGNAVSLTGGASVNINNPIADLGNNGSWTVSAWVKTTTPGATILSKSDGGWGSGNTIFYLGDGTAGGSGGIPSAVRWGGGFYQGSTAATAVNNNAWRQVTYVNNSGSYAIYVDGVAQPLSAGNAGFVNADIGSIVRLGATTNTVAGDGTVNFNGLLDGVQFYSSALSATQVSALYQGVSTFSPLPATTNVNIASGATLDVNGVSQQIGSLTGPAGANVTLGAGKLTVSSNADSQFSGALSGTGGSLTKQGAGVLTLSGASTYTGPTTVDAGTLRVNGSTAPLSAVTVTGGVLAGTGMAAGAVTIQAGGRLAPGASIGTLTVGSLNLAASSILDFELNTVAGADTSDRVNITANNGLVINGGVLNLTNTGSMTGGTYTLLDYVGTFTGSVSSLAFGVVPSGYSYSLIDNTAATTIDLVVTPQLPSDYNSDGAVDAADYTLWRDNVGAPAGTLPNDPTGVAIGSAQYDLWVANFAAAGSGLAATTAVPEPAAMASVLLLAMGGFIARRESCTA